MNKLIARIFLVLSLLALFSCERRPLEDPSEAISIRIKVDVKAVTNVNTNIRNSIKLYGTNTGAEGDDNLAAGEFYFYNTNADDGGWF